MPDVLAPLVGAGAGLAASAVVLALARFCSPVAGRGRRDMLLTAAACTVAGAALALRVPLPDLVPFALAVLLAGAAAVVDLRERRLPDVLTWPAAVVALGGLAVVAALTGRPFVGALIGSAAFAGSLFALGFAAGGVGLGDVKAAIGIGALLGWRGPQHWFAGVLIGLVLLVGAGLAVRASRSLSDVSLPYGPALVMGAVLAL